MAHCQKFYLNHCLYSTIINYLVQEDIVYLAGAS